MSGWRETYADKPRQQGARLQVGLDEKSKVSTKEVPVAEYPCGLHNCHVGVCMKAPCLFEYWSMLTPTFFPFLVPSHSLRTYRLCGCRLLSLVTYLPNIHRNKRRNLILAPDATLFPPLPPPNKKTNAGPSSAPNKRKPSPCFSGISPLKNFKKRPPSPKKERKKNNPLCFFFFWFKNHSPCFFLEQKRHHQTKAKQTQTKRAPRKGPGTHRFFTKLTHQKGDGPRSRAFSATVAALKSRPSAGNCSARRCSSSTEAPWARSIRAIRSTAMRRLAGRFGGGDRSLSTRKTGDSVNMEKKTKPLWVSWLRLESVKSSSSTLV